MRKIKEAWLLSPSLLLRTQIKILYLPYAKTNQFISLYLGENRQYVYETVAIFYDLPLSFYAVLANRDYNAHHDFAQILIKGEFSEGWPVLCDSEKFADLELPQMPTRWNYFKFKSNELETKFVECKSVMFKDSMQDPFLEVEEINYVDILDYIKKVFHIQIR